MYKINFHKLEDQRQKAKCYLIISFPPHAHLCEFSRTAITELQTKELN